MVVIKTFVSILKMLDPLQTFLLPRSRIQQAKVVNACPEDTEPKDYLMVILGLLIEEKTGKKLQEFAWENICENIEELSNVAFHDGMSPSQAIINATEAITTYMTIRRQRSTSRRSTTNSPPIQAPMTPEHLKEMVRNVVKEETASTKGRKATKPTDSLVEYVRFSKNESSEEASETSSSMTSQKPIETLKNPFKELSILWEPTTWGMYLETPQQLQEWSITMREMFVNTTTLKEHQFIKNTNEQTLLQFESFIQLALTTGTIAHDRTIRTIENTLTQMQSMIMHATNGKDTAEEYRALKSLALLPKRERMVRKEAIRMAKTNQSTTKTPFQPATSIQKKSTATATTTHVPAETWAKMTMEDRKLHIDLQKRMKELQKK